MSKSMQTAEEFELALIKKEAEAGVRRKVLREQIEKLGTPTTTPTKETTPASTQRREEALFQKATESHMKAQQLDLEMQELARNLEAELNMQKMLQANIQRRVHERKSAAGLHAAALQKEKTRLTKEAMERQDRQNDEELRDAHTQAQDLFETIVTGNGNGNGNSNRKGSESKTDEAPTTRNPDTPITGYPGWFDLSTDDQLCYYNAKLQKISLIHPQSLGYRNDEPRQDQEQEEPKKIDWSTSDEHRKTFFWIAAFWELVILILFIVFGDYVDVAKPISEDASELDHYYPFFQDVHVMIFIGFGFLMTFLHRYGFSAVGYNFLLAAFTIQWSILVSGIFSGLFAAPTPFPPTCPPYGYTLVRHEAIAMNDTTRFCIDLDMESLVLADFAAAAVLITYGAVLGKTNPTQMLIVAVMEILFYELNIQIGGGFQAVDMGGSIFVHTFGAYFGLALSWVMTSSKLGEQGLSGALATKARESIKASTPTSDMFAMVGTIFLWMFWPSFNGALAPDDQQYRVVINTVLALSACCVTAFAVDNLVRPDHKFDMVSIQNATLAGGVAVGSSSDLVIMPWGAVLIGMVAGALSVCGYRYIQPALEHAGLDDTCGVHNLHGMPGILGGLSGAIAAALADQAYGHGISNVFPARGDIRGRTAGEQSQSQLAAVFVTLIISIIGGTITGIIVKSNRYLYFGQIKGGQEAVRYHVCNLCHSSDPRIWYDDAYYWSLPDEDDEENDEESNKNVNENDQSDESDEGQEVEV